MIANFDSVEAFGADCFGDRRIVEVMNASTARHAGERAWYSYESVAQTDMARRHGSDTLVSSAETLMDNINASLELPQRVWAATPAGIVPSVPDVIMGLPEPMRAPAWENNDRAPVNVWVAVTSSGGVDQIALAKRGTAALALTMALIQSGRPTTLTLLNTLSGMHGGETVIAVRIETAPLMLATACWALTSQGFARRMCYDWSRVRNHSGCGWPRDFNWSNPAPYFDALVSRLGGDPSRDVTLYPTTLATELVIANPVKWVNERLAAIQQHT